MKKKEIDEYIKSKSITQDQYVAPTVRTNVVDTRKTAPAMVQVAQTVKPTQTIKQTSSFSTQPSQKVSNDIRTVDTVNKKEQPKEEKRTVKDAIREYGNVLKNSRVKEKGLSWDNAITDLANIYDAKQKVAESIPVIGNLFKTKNTAVNAATNMGTGALKSLESAADTASDLVFNPIERRYNYAYDLLTKGKKTADENLEDLKKMQQRDIKKDMTSDFLEKTGYNDVVDDLEKGSLITRENLGGQVAQGVGGMVPALVLGQAFGGTPELSNLSGLTGKERLAAMAGNVGKTYMAQLPSNLMLGASSYGSGVEDALNQGASMNRARAYGASNAAIEQLTEMLTGGVPGLEGKGGLDQFVDPLINRNTNGYLNALLRAGYGALGEGLEEWSAEYLDALARQGILGQDVDWNEVRKNARQAGLVGALTGTLLNSPSNIQDIQNVRTENQIRNVLGDAEYAEGNQQYNPDYKGWESQREENRIENERKESETQQRREEVERVNQERAEEEARKAQEMAQEAQREEEQRQQEEVKQAQEAPKASPREASDYDKYYKRANLDNFDSTMVDKAKEIISSNKQGRRTKQEWLDIAQNIGSQLKGQDAETIKKYAYESFKQERPNVKDNLNRQGQKYVSFKVDEWVDAVQKAAKSTSSNIETNVEQQSNPKITAMQDELKRMDINGTISNNYTPEQQRELINKVYDENLSEKQLQENLYDEVTRQYVSKMSDRLLRNAAQDTNMTRDEFIKRHYNKSSITGETKEDIGRIYDEYNNKEVAKEPAKNLAEAKEEPVLKIETPQQEKQHFMDNGMNEETAKILSEMPKTEKQPLRERIKEGKAKISEEWSYLKRNLVDKGETIYTLGKKTKNPNLYAKYDKRGTTTGEANYDIGVAQTNLEGKRYENFTNANGKKTSMSLNQIWEGVDPAIANEYLAHYLNVDRYNQLNQDGTQKYVFGESITDEDSLKRVKQLEKEHPELKRFGENVWQYGKNQLQNMVDAGKISQAQADSFLKETPHYVRLQRNVEKTSSPLLEFDRKGNVKVNKNIKEFKGSTLDILPFKESMAKYTLDVRNSIRDNIFAQELAKTLGVGTDGGAVTDIEDIFGTNPDLLKDNGDGTYSLTFFNKGTATTIPINEGIYESLQPNKHYKFEDTLPFKGIRKIDSWRKALLTERNPMFLATNMMKDAFDAPLNSKYPVSFVKNYPRAVYEIIKGGKNYQQYQALGGLQNTYFDNQQFKKQGSKYNPLTWIEKANNAIEQIPRLAEFMSTIEKTGDVDQAMYNAAEVTTNFKRGGDITKAANRNGATFLNASVQGFDKQIRNFTDIQSPKQAVQMLGKVLVLGIAPGLLNDLMWDDDDEYKEMQDYQKDRYYLFKGKDGQWIRIPKGRAVSIFQSAARRTKYAMQGEENAFKDFGKFASGQVAPNNPFENNIISPIVDVSRNESWSGNKIIPTAYEKKKAEKQYNEKTDKLSRKISEEINKSELAKKVIPKNFRSAMGINYLIDQYSGAIGDITLPYITPKVSSRNGNPLSAPILDKFTTDSVYSNKSVNSFYDTMNKLAEEDENPIDVAKNNYMTSKSIALSQLYKEQRNIQNDESLDKDEKYEKAREVQKEINKFAKDTVKNINNIEQQEYYLKIGDDYYKRVIKDGEEKYIKDSSKKIPTDDKYALYDYFKEKYEKSKEEKK